MFLHFSVEAITEKILWKQGFLWLDLDSLEAVRPPALVSGCVCRQYEENVALSWQAADLSVIVGRKKKSTERPENIVKKNDKTFP